MIRLAELAVFTAPFIAFLLWRLAIARGLDGPPPRQLLAIALTLTAFAAGLIALAEQERLPPGRYIPAQLIDGHVVPGHTAPPANGRPPGQRPG